MNTTTYKDVDSRGGSFLDWQLLAVFNLALAVSLVYIPGDYKKHQTERSYSTCRALRLV